jgi:uncharacterized protein (TIGR03067 family)
MNIAVHPSLPETMKTLLPCALLALLVHSALAQSKSTPPPFPGWADKVATPSAGVAGATDKKDLLGQWEGFVSMGDGANPGQGRMNIKLNITPDKITSSGAGNIGEGTYRISGGSSKLQHIDATGTAGQYRGKQYEGIFTVEGNTLKWCAGDPGSGRPTALRTNPAAGHFLMVLTRKQ